MSIPVSQFIFPDGASDEESACQCRSCRRQVRSLAWEDPLGEEIATHSSILAWEIPWTEESGGLQPMRLQESAMSERPNKTNNKEHTGATSFFPPFGFNELKFTFPKFPPTFALALLSEATQLMAFTSLRMTIPPQCYALYTVILLLLSERKS